MPSSGINTYNETELHRAIKAWGAGRDAVHEQPVDGYIIDAVADGVLVEVQTGNFAKLRPKLVRLVKDHRVRLIHPIAVDKWIVRQDAQGKQLSRRKSPKRGRLEDVFGELVSLPKLLSEPNFSLEVALIHEEELRVVDGKRRRFGRDWQRADRRLLEVVDRRAFHEPGDFACLLPRSLPTPFATADLARQRELSRSLAQQMAYCLREMGVIEAVGRSRVGVAYRRVG